MRDRRASVRRITGFAGLGAAVLFAAGNALWAFDQPDAGASVRTILTFYRHTSTGIVAGASLSVASCALLAVFASGVRAILSDHADEDLFATAAFGGMLLLIAAGLAAETINMIGALRAGSGQLTPELARAVFEISFVLGYNAAGAGIGIVLLATSAVALRGPGLMPRWVALFTLIAGLVFLTPLSRFLLAPAVLLLVAVSAQLLRAHPQENAIALRPRCAVARGRGEVASLNSAASSSR